MALSSLQGVSNLHNVRHPFFIWFHLHGVRYPSGHGVRDPLGYVIDMVSDNVQLRQPAQSKVSSPDT